MTTIDDLGAQETIGGARAIVAVLLRYRRQVVGVPTIATVLFVLVMLLLPRNYSSSAVIVPRAEGGGSAVAGLAAQFGITVPSTGSMSPRVVQAVILSPRVRRDVVTRRYDLPVRSGSGADSIASIDLVEYFEIEEDDPERGVQEAMEELDSYTSTNVDDLAGTITVRATFRDAALSLAVCEAILERVQYYNSTLRQSQARAERVFVESRLDDARESLRRSEDSLLTFLSSNRDIRNSPALQATQDRMQRALALRQQVVVSLAQAFEQSQIAEVRDTPVIAVVSEPLLAAKPDRRGLLLKMVLVFVLLMGAVVVCAFGVEILRVAGGGESADHRFDELVGAAKEDALRLIRRVPLFGRARRA